MLTHYALAAVLLIAGRVDNTAGAALVGTWGLEGRPLMTFNADGTGSMSDAPVRWKADGAVLTVTTSSGETDKTAYKVSGNQMAIAVNGATIQLTKIGAVSAKGDAQAPAAKSKDKPAARVDTKDQLSMLLLSSAWCSFHYNKISGSSSTTRFAYRNDGTWSTGGRAETYSSGANGTVSGQSDSTGGGTWAVRSNQLYLSSPETGGQLVPVQLSITRNASGYPIITANGVEYSQCQ